MSSSEHPQGPVEVATETFRQQNTQLARLLVKPDAHPLDIYDRQLQVEAAGQQLRRVREIAHLPIAQTLSE